MNLDVSVLMPVYLETLSVENVRRMRIALESVFEQRFPGELEVIIVDDGSPIKISDFEAVFRSLPRNSIRWIRYDRNYGIVHALNAGLRKAKHSLIARIDADDQWCAGKIEKQCNLFLNDLDLTIVGTGMTRISPNQEIIDELIRPGDWRGILRFFVEIGSPFPHGSVIGRRDIYHLLGGYPHDLIYKHCEDYALWGMWLRFFKPAIIEESLYKYTVSLNSLSAQNSNTQAESSKGVREKFRWLESAASLPGAVDALSNCLGISTLQAGVLSLRMWRSQTPIFLPREAIAPLQTILSDRIVECVNGDYTQSAIEMKHLLYGFDHGSEIFEHFSSVLVARSY